MTEPTTAIDAVLEVFTGVGNWIGITGIDVKTLFEADPWFSGITSVFSFIATIKGLANNNNVQVIIAGTICLWAVISFIATVLFF